MGAGPQVGQLAELASSGAALMMCEKISPSLAAVSPPSSWSVLREQAVSLDNHRPPSGPIACREGRGSRKWIHTGETDRLTATRPRPPTQPVGTTAETMAEHQARSQSVLPRQPVRPAKRTQIAMQRGPETSCIIYVLSRQAVAPRGGGVLQLRVARKLYNYVSSSQELSPPQPPAPVPLTCNRTVRLFRVASMS